KDSFGLFAAVAITSAIHHQLVTGGGAGDGRRSSSTGRSSNSGYFGWSARVTARLDQIGCERLVEAGGHYPAHDIPAATEDFCRRVPQRCELRGTPDALGRRPGWLG